MSWFYYNKINKYVLQISEDPTLPLLHSGTQSNDIVSLCDIIATEFETSKDCQRKVSSTLKLVMISHVL